MRKGMIGMLMLAAVTISWSSVQAEFAPQLVDPTTSGDQVIYFYDARPSFTSFLTIRNSDSETHSIAVDFYGPTIDGEPFERIVTLPAGGSRIIDVGALHAEGLPRQAGVVFATAIDAVGQPIVSGSLSGNFTIANLATGSAWGGRAPARTTWDVEFERPPTGGVIDNDFIALRPIRPFSLSLAAFYDPDTLAPVAKGGNQLIFVTFEEVPGPVASFRVKSATTNWNVFTKRRNGTSSGPINFFAPGVTVSDLASVAGFDVGGSSGSMSFAAQPVGDDGGVTRMIFFAEALGSFGTGYMLAEYTRTGL